MEISDLNKHLGNIDIYLLDQILKGRYKSFKKVLDAGCGEGRNLIYFLNNKYDVYGIDQNPNAIRMLQFVSKSINHDQLKENFSVGSIAKLPYADHYFELIICSAVLHFAENQEHFLQMFNELVRVAQKDSQIFIRMASNIGAEQKINTDTNSKTQIPDGSFRFLLTRSLLEKLMTDFPVKLIEPVKTVNVEDKRFMTTLVLQKQ